MLTFRSIVLPAALIAAGCGGGGSSKVGDAQNNVPPVARDSTIEIDEDSGVLRGEMVATDSNAADKLFFSIAEDRTNGGNLTVFGTGGATGQARSNPEFEYEPRLNFNGTDSFTFNVNDGLAADQGTVTIIVRPVNDAPVAGDDTASTDIDVALAITVLDNDSDVDREDVTITQVDAATAEGGTAAINDNATPDDPTDDFIDYMPSAGFNGVDTFGYTVADPGGVTNTGLVTVQVGPAASLAMIHDSRGNR